MKGKISFKFKRTVSLMMFFFGLLFSGELYAQTMVTGKVTDSKAAPIKGVTVLVKGNDIIHWGWLYDGTKLAELKIHDADFNTWAPGNEYLPIPQCELDLNKNPFTKSCKLKCFGYERLLLPVSLSGREFFPGCL